MAWDHPRALLPLAAISADWSKRRNFEVVWEARPLKDFEDQPLEELAEAYDLVLIDHPFVGTAAQSGLIVPVDDWVDDDYLRDQRAHSVGPSFASYTWAGKQWALAIDAAAQVSAVREDLLSATKRDQPPATWPDVAGWASELDQAPGRIAIPLNPNHAYSAFLAIGVSLAGRAFWPKGGHVDPVSAADSLRFLREIAPDLHPLSRTSDPIAISNHMSESDEIVYVPLMFGYSNYARPGFRSHSLRFGNAPYGEGGYIGSVLGGVGIALSARSNEREAAAELARTIGAPEVQAGIYTSSGGQPGHSAAWLAPGANRCVRGFFLATRTTMEHAFMRPRVPGHRRFQELAGILIRDSIWQPDRQIQTCLDEFNRLTDEYLGDWE
jgi:multiple sugar transport system substrate-binding protein